MDGNVNRTQPRLRRAMLLAMIGALLPQIASAQLASEVDRKCIDAINKGTRKIALGNSKELRACTFDLAAGLLGSQTVAQCAASSARVQSAIFVGLLKADHACNGLPPSFGPPSISAHTGLAVQAGAEILEDIFGPVPDVVLAPDSVVLGCQSAVMKAAGKCSDARVKYFNKCKKSGLKRGFVTTSDELRDACLGTGATQPDPTGGGIASACTTKMLAKIESSCVARGVDLIAAFPGCVSTSGSDLTSCIDERISCRTCGLLNASDGLTRDCDLMDDGNDQNGSCGEPTTCGDGDIDGAEACDDGDATSGDGCSATCQVETGWVCVGEPSVCTSICGDGLLGGAEACDDGGLVSGDGCSALCQVEPGYSCSGAPSVCTPGCGDGLVRGSEGCDDNDTSPGDGCGATCQVETGWTCLGEPSTCTAICGDGLVRGAEACDDSGLVPGDGCGATCQVEPGWACGGQPSTCTSVCGDGLVRGNEQCDDDGTTSGNGCDATCQVETGWTCSGEPSSCSPICGDGFLRGGETCDDGGTSPGDGCSATCTVETGWACTGQPSTCDGICGDGLVRGTETCDDDFTSPGDGCSGGCDVETGWVCVGEPSVCTPECGDGIVLFGEACDDGDLDSGDGCSATCLIESGWSCSGDPSECDPICGDGLLRGDEECDDGDAAMGDGCSAICEVEAGYVCSGQPSLCVQFGVTITAPVHGVFTTASSIAVTGFISNLAPAAASLTINGVTVPIAPGGTFSTTVSLSASAIFNPIRATVTELTHGSQAHARVVAIRGLSIADGTLSPQSVGLRVTDGGLNDVEPLVASLAGTGLNLAAMIPVGTVLVDDECFIDCGLGCCPGGRGSVTVINPPASIGGFGLAADSMTNFVAADITVSDIRVNVYLDGGALIPECDIAIHADAAFFNGDYAMQPMPGDPENIDVNQIGALDVDFTGFTTSYGGTCDFPGIGAVIQAFLPDVEQLTIDSMATFLSDPDGNGPLDSPTANGIETALAGVSIAGPIGESLGVNFDAPLFTVAEDNNGITFGSDSRFTVSIGNGPGQCQPPVGAPNLTASLAFNEGFPTFGTTTPGGQSYDLAISISTEGFNQLLRSQVECGLLVTSISSLDLGSGPIPITAGLLAALMPEFNVFPPATPFRIDVRPTLAPVVIGTAGPNGELATLKMSQLIITVVRDDGSNTVVLQGAVDADMGLNFQFVSGALNFVLGTPEVEDITVAVLLNPLGVDVVSLETGILPPLIAELIPSLASSLSSFPLPEFLGLNLQGVQVARTGEFMTLYVNLVPGP